MLCSLSKRSTRMARGMNLTMSGHHPPAKHQKPPVRLCNLMSGRFTRTNLRLTPFGGEFGEGFLELLLELGLVEPLFRGFGP